MINSVIDFTCPNCNSKKYIGKTSIGKKYKEEPYVNVTSEIQCAICFMDIPSNISENISSEDQKKCLECGLIFISLHIRRLQLNALNVLDIIGR